MSVGFGHLRSYEQDLPLATVKDPRIELELRQTIWHLYKQWEVAAEELFRRARSLHRESMMIHGIDRLNDEIGRIQARLTVKPEYIFNACRQVRDGQVVLAKELRDES